MLYLECPVCKSKFMPVEENFHVNFCGKNCICCPYFLTSDSHLPKQFVLFSWIESPLKMMKNVFYFILKVLSVLKIFRLLSRLFGHVGKTARLEKGWIRSLTSKFMTSQPGLQTIAIHILSNISRSKGNQTMKFGQLIEYNEKYFSSKIM